MSTPITLADCLTAVQQAMQAQFTLDNLVAIVVAVIGATALIALAWIGIRKMVKGIARVLKGGKISI